MLLPSDIEIETPRLMLRLVQEADLPALFVANSDDEVTRYLPYESWKDMDEARAWLNRATTRFAADEAAQFVVEDRQSASVVGSCLLFHFEPELAQAEVGYVLARRYWGAGYMFEAMQALMAFAFEYQFDRFTLSRLVAIVDSRNTASSMLLKRLGFDQDGPPQQREPLKGEPSASIFYSVVRAERA